MKKNWFLTVTFLSFIVGGFIVHSVQASDKNFAVEVVSDTIEVTMGFNGSTIEIFGDRQNTNSDIVIIVEGPRKDTTIWKKERVMGAWVNRYYITFKKMPIYYSYASTAVLDKKKISKDVRKDKVIGHEALFESLETKKSGSIKDESVYKEALLERKYVQGVYFDKPENVNLINEHLFRVRFNVPASARTGDYKIRSLFIENGRVTQEKTDILKVKQVGLNAFVFSMATKHSVLYAVLAIFIALFSGWFASIIKVRP